MGAKHVCFTCRKAFNAPYSAIGPTKCPECGQQVRVVSHRFRPPKKREIAKWELAKYLVDHGFPYHHVLEHPQGGKYVKYPESMQDAKEFIERFQAQAVKKK